MPIDRETFFNHVRHGPFPGFLTVPQVKGMEAILDAWDGTAFSDLRWLAYCLATTFHETARRMQPVEEYGKGKGHPYGLPVGPWHNVYDGRGDVQLTWESNYQKASTKLKAHGFSVDLDRNPDDAMKPDVAAAILIYGMVEGWFTGKRLTDYFSVTVADPVNARRIVNGLDQASVIAGYFKTFVEALTFAAKKPAAPAPPASEPTPAAPVAVSEAKPTPPSAGGSGTSVPPTPQPQPWSLGAWLASLFFRSNAS